MRAGAIFGALNTIPTFIARDGSRTSEELQRAVARLLEDDMPSLR